MLITIRVCVCVCLLRDRMLWLNTCFMLGNPLARDRLSYEMLCVLCSQKSVGTQTKLSGIFLAFTQLLPKYWDI